MLHDEDNENETTDSGGRRRFLGAAAVGAAGVWAAPQIMSAASADADGSALPDGPTECGAAFTSLYSEDFEGTPALTMWSRTSGSPVIATAPSDRRFLGASDTPGAPEQFGTEIVSLSLEAPDGACELRVSFDFLRIRSWDGEDIDTFTVRLLGGPDLVKRTSFQWKSDSKSQAYPRPITDPERSFGGTGQQETDAMGYHEKWGDGIYPFPPAIPDEVSTLVVPIVPGPFVIEFEASLTQPGSDESWGLDNVHVEVSVLA